MFDCFFCKNEGKSKKMCGVIKCMNSFKLMINTIIPYLQLNYFVVWNLILSHVTVLNISGKFNITVNRGLQQVM